MVASDPSTVRLLLVEDDEEDYRLVRQWLADSEDGPFRLEWVATIEAANAALARAEHDTCLLDYRLGEHSGLDLLREAIAHHWDTPIILLTGQGDAAVDAAALRAGAADYLVKDEITPPTLVRSIRHAIERRRLILRSQAEQQERQRAERALHAVVSRAHCLLWQAEVAEHGQNNLGWQLRVSDEAAAQRFLPLDTTGYGSYAEAWYASRLDSDRDNSDVSGNGQVRLDQNYRQEFRCRDRHGVVHWLVEDVQVEALSPGRWRAVGVCTDITEIREAERALRESRDLLQAVIESSADPIFVKDHEGRYLLRNMASVALGGNPSDEAVGKLDSEFIPPEALQQMRQHDHQVMRTAAPLVTEDILTEGGFSSSLVVTEVPALPGEELRTFLTTRSPFRDASGAIVGVVGIAKEITERNRLEEQLRQAQKMEAVGRLAGGVAHDFNNMLAVIIGYSDLLLCRPGTTSDPALTEYLGEIKKAGESAATLTRQLLAFSRKQVLEPQILDLGELVMKTRGMLRPLIREDIELAVRVQTDLYPVKADPGQIEQVLLNLVVNGRDAMPEGGKLTIEVENAEFDEVYAREHPYIAPGCYVLLSVTDTGCGMSTETLKHIFEPFYTTKPQEQGTGLGLATVFGIIKQSGGHVEVASEVGSGSTFEVYLPRTTVPRQDSHLEPVIALAGSETVLVAEDDDTVRSMVRNILEMYGYSVVTARNGPEALEAAAEHPGTLDLLLTDVIMPGGMGARVLVAKLGALRPEVKILYMSGYPDDALLGHSILSGEIAFIQKPFTPLSLVRKVREVLG